MSKKQKSNKTMGQTLKLSSLQKDVLIGLMLGDGHLESQTFGRTYKLLVEQSGTKHKDYLMHLYEIFKPFVLREPCPRKNRTTLMFRTITHPVFRFYGKLFYRLVVRTEASKRKAIKIVPSNIHRFLNDRVLAYWYMDDGALKGQDRSGKRLHTEGFTKIEVDLLADTLNKMGIETTVNRQNRKGRDTTYLLNITAKGDRVLTKRIEPYIHSSMVYKLYPANVLFCG
jgi:hypothetical protein